MQHIQTARWACKYTFSMIHNHKSTPRNVIIVITDLIIITVGMLTELGSYLRGEKLTL